MERIQVLRSKVSKSEKDLVNLWVLTEKEQDNINIKTIRLLKDKTVKLASDYSELLIHYKSLLKLKEDELFIIKKRSEDRINEILTNFDTLITATMGIEK